jgi:hypothetical protein
MKKLLLGIMKQNCSFSAKKYQLVKSLLATNKIIIYSGANGKFFGYAIGVDVMKGEF